MPPLNKEAFRRIANGNMSSQLKFIRFRQVRQQTRETIPHTVGHVVYFIDAQREHKEIFGEVLRDRENGQLPLPEDIELIEDDAGRIKKTATGEVVFWSNSKNLRLGKNPIKRAETGKFVQDEIADSDTRVLCEV